jgi:hypothetical protein
VSAAAAAAGGDFRGDIDHYDGQRSVQQLPPHRFRIAYETCIVACIVACIEACIVGTVDRLHGTKEQAQERRVGQRYQSRVQIRSSLSVLCAVQRYAELHPNRSKQPCS